MAGPNFGAWCSGLGSDDERRIDAAAASAQKRGFANGEAKPSPCWAKNRRQQLLGEASGTAPKARCMSYQVCVLTRAATRSIAMKLGVASGLLKRKRAISNNPGEIVFSG
jgi:hypothetical protein